jgi:hypothetical protein
MLNQSGTHLFRSIFIGLSVLMFTPLPVEGKPGPDADSSQNKVIRFGKHDPEKNSLKTKGGPMFTSRPLLAVGTIKKMDLVTSRVQVLIDRKRSSLPRVLKIKAEKSDQLESILDQEFPEVRSFLLHDRTLGLDARLDMRRNQVRADSGRIHEDRQFLPVESFKPGDSVSVLFRMSSTPDHIARVLTISKVDPAQENFEADFRPMNKNIQIVQPPEKTPVSPPNP